MCVFYALDESDISGSLNLLQYYQLESAYQKMALTKHPKEELSSFLPDLPGFLDTPASEDKSSLRDLWENPQRVRKEIDALPAHLLNGFRLKPGAVRTVWFLIYRFAAPMGLMIDCTSRSID